MGAAVGQVPEYIQQAAEWCKAVARIPVIVKLTPNVTNILAPAKAAKDGGADAVSLINTLNSIMRVDYDTLTMYPTTDGMGSHGGYCGPAVKPIALHMVAEIARNEATRGLPISGIGGVTDWRDAVDFLALGAGNVQVCTAAMVYGFRIIDDLTSGLSHFLRDKGMSRVADLVGRAVPSVTDWKYLNLNYVVKARINQDLCIQCGRCHIVCEDASHQAITHTVDGKRRFEVIDQECVGCNLCVSVCPVVDCITMELSSAWTPHGRAITARNGLDDAPTTDAPPAPMTPTTGMLRRDRGSATRTRGRRHPDRRGAIRRRRPVAWARPQPARTGERSLGARRDGRVPQGRPPALLPRQGHGDDARALLVLQRPGAAVQHRHRRGRRGCQFHRRRRMAA
jgi:NAD-dependent dihydropyrimidine dehydrogenase PreA subunit